MFLHTSLASSSLLLIICYIPLGLISGFLAGLFGIGGGLVNVPILLLTFDLLGFNHNTNYHLAVGTSLCIMISTSLNAALQHHKRLSTDWSTLSLLLPGLSIGCVLSGYLFPYLPRELLKYAFALFLTLVLIHFITTNHHKNPLKKSEPSYKLNKWAGLLGGLAIGTISPLLGIGGGTMTTPLLHHYRISLTRIVGISCWISLIIAITGTINTIYSGWSQADLPPHSFGYLYWPAALAISLVSLISVRFGVFCTHYLPPLALKRLFVTLLGIMIIKSLI